MSSSSTPTLPALLWWGCAVLLLIATLPMAYGYYQFLRLAIFLAGTIIAVTYWRKASGWSVVLGALSLMFNPLIPVRFSRESWFLIDVAAAGIFGAHWFFVAKKKPLLQRRP